MADSSYALQLETKLNQFPLLSRYLGCSLYKRIGQENWYESRVLRYILSGAEWVADLEEAFRSASIDKVTNSGLIFSGLRRAPKDYDNQLLDALAEVRLTKWARQQGYSVIEKLDRESAAGTLKSKVPDFRMERGSEVAIAEAKNLRARDFLLDFLDDRIHGLVFKTGRFAKFGLDIATGDEYEQKRKGLLGTGVRGRAPYIKAARLSLTEEWLESLERTLDREPSRQVEIKVIGVPFSIQRVDFPGVVNVGQTYGSNKLATTMSMLRKLKGLLLDEKLKQIKSYIDAHHLERHSLLPLVFVSGMGPEERDWSLLWEVLCGPYEESVWRAVADIRTKGISLTGTPFYLIVRQGIPPKYGPFPWKPEDRRPQ